MARVRGLLIDDSTVLLPNGKTSITFVGCDESYLETVGVAPGDVITWIANTHSVDFKKTKARPGELEKLMALVNADAHVKNKLAKARANAAKAAKAAKAEAAKPRPKPVAKPRKPSIDLSLPDVVRDAFVGLYLPVVVTRAPFTRTLKDIVAKLSPPDRKRVSRGFGSFDGKVGTLSFKHISASDCAAYKSELEQVRVKKGGEMVRVLPSAWFADPKPEDELLALGVLCAVARSGQGVVYARPGGRKLDSGNGDGKVAVAFDFTDPDNAQRV